jgi:hypothetical protein
VADRVLTLREINRANVALYRKAASSTSIFYPNLYPNPPQHHPTQTDTPRRGSP